MGAFCKRRSVQQSDSPLSHASSLRPCLFFVESSIHQVAQGGEGEFGVITFGFELQFGAFRCREHHHLHDALAVDALRPFANADFA